jgi:hypothetical protein
LGHTQDRRRYRRRADMSLWQIGDACNQFVNLAIFW